MILYEYRIYSPDFGRWLSREPRQLASTAIVPYSTLANSAIGRVDVLGLFDYTFSLADGGMMSFSGTGHHVIPREVIQKLLDCDLLDRDALIYLNGGIDTRRYTTAALIEMEIDPNTGKPHIHNNTRHGIYNDEVEKEVDLWIENRAKRLKQHSASTKCCVSSRINLEEVQELTRYIRETKNPFVKAYLGAVKRGPNAIRRAVDRHIPPGRLTRLFRRKACKAVCNSVPAVNIAVGHSDASTAAVAITEKTGSEAAGIGAYIYMQSPFGDASQMGQAFIEMGEGLRDWSTEYNDSFNGVRLPDLYYEE